MSETLVLGLNGNPSVGVVLAVTGSDFQSLTVKSTLDTNLAGHTNNDLTFTSLLLGLRGDDITVSYINTAVPNQALTLVEDTDAKTVEVKLALGAGTAEIQHLSAKASSGTWTATYKTFTTAALQFDVSTANLQTALRALHADLAAVVVTGGPGALSEATPYVVTFPNASINPDQITMTDVSLAGSGHAANASTATPYVAPAITTIASDIVTLINAQSELVSAANKAANNGTGLVEAMAPTNLDNGADAGTVSVNIYMPGRNAVVQNTVTTDGSGNIELPDTIEVDQMGVLVGQAYVADTLVATVNQQIFNS